MKKTQNHAGPFECVRTWTLGLFVLALLALPTEGVTQSLIQGNYYWYSPEHEKYTPTVFYGEPRFDSRTVRVKSAQRFKLLAGGKGWFMIQFDVAGKAYIHQRLLRNMMYDPTTGDPWTEFQRASVFDEDPAKIEARMQTVRTDPQASPDLKVPSWKRYKDSWGLKSSRSPSQPSTNGDSTADAASSALPSRPQDKKARSKYPLLPPIGSQPNPQNESEAGPTSDGTNIPTPQQP